MVDTAVTAPPAGEVAVPVDTGTPLPTPINTEIHQEQAKPQPKSAEKPAERPSVMDAVKKAAAEVKAKAEAKVAEEAKNDKSVVKNEKADQAKPEAKAEAKPLDTRGPDGKFQARAAETGQPKPDGDGEPTKQPYVGRAEDKGTIHEPPARFSEDVKAIWRGLPDNVKGETHRAIREIEQGVQKYRESHEAFEPIREYHEIASKNGIKLQDSLKTIVDIEDTLQKDPLAGMDKICRRLGLDVRKIAQGIIDRTPGEEASALALSTQEQTNAKLAEVDAKLKELAEREQRQQLKDLEDEAVRFRSQNPRFDELQDDMILLIEAKRASTLAEAYQLADRLNPAPKTEQPKPQEAAAAQTGAAPEQPNPAGKVQIGGKTSGSDPASQPAPAASIREAIEQAAKKLKR